MTRWPKDDPVALKAFYGDPGKGEVDAQLIDFTPPWKMYYEGQPVSHFKFHRKAAPALKAALDEIWGACNHEQALIEHLNLHRFDGAYNKRLVRGSSTKWSNHAFGAAIDIDAQENGFNSAGTMPDFVVGAFERQGARWGGRYRTRKDPMHFEFCYNGRDIPVAGDAHVKTEPKPLQASKISNTQIAAGAGAVLTGADVLNDAADKVQRAHDAADQVNGLLAQGMKIIEIAGHNPALWLSVAVVIAAALTIYWRWKDHGRGQEAPNV